MMESALTPRQLAEQICHTLRASGHQAFLVGGCVRDELLGRVPADYDVATDAVPSRVEELFPGSLTVGAKFGVVVVPRDGLHVKSQLFVPTSAIPMAAILIKSSMQKRRKKT